MNQSLRSRSPGLALTGFLTALSLPAAAQSPVPEGFSLEHRTVLPQKPLLFDLLPGGDVIACDDTDLFRVDRLGGTHPLDKLPPNASVSFVRTMPGGNAVVVGTSGGDILRHDLTPGTFRTITKIPFNFDLVFDYAGRGFLSANPGLGTPGAGNQIFLLDCVTGAAKSIARLTGPSGPVEVARDGSLFYAVQSDTFPTPAGFITVLRFPAARVLAAIQGSELREADGLVWAKGLDGGYGMALDDRGRLLVSDPAGGIARIGPAGGLEPQLFVAKDPNYSQFTLRFVKEGFGTFSAYQPPTAGRLWYVEADRKTVATTISALRPQRPAAFALPSAPIPDGPMDLVVAGAPPDGAALFLLSRGRQPIEDHVFMPGGDPLWFQIDPATIFFVTLVAMQPSGTGKLRLANPPEVRGEVMFQSIVFRRTAELAGSSSPAPLVLD
jgi:hypothetical protein